MNKLRIIISIFIAILCVAIIVISGLGIKMIKMIKITNILQIHELAKKNEPTTTVYYHSILDNITIDKVDFNITKDLISLLHIPKTGGSEFEVKIIKNLTRYNYHNKTWIHVCEKKPNEVLDLKINNTYAKYYCGRGSNYTLRKPYSMLNSWMFSRNKLINNLSIICHIFYL